MNHLIHRFWGAIQWRMKILILGIKIKSRKNVFVFGAPYHSNMGDQAQSYCIERWATQAYPGFRVWIFDTAEISAEDFFLLRFIRKTCNKADKILLHSGYHTTDLYILEEKLQRQVITWFPDRQVVLLPQTIYYQSQEEATKSSEIYNAHPDLLLMCRDEVSYGIAEKLFTKCRNLLFPDVVTTMIGVKQYHYERSGILLCLRNDQEAFYSPEQIQLLKEQLSDIGTVSVTDTTITMDAKEIRKNRETVLEQIWSDYAKYRVIITDRYHGTIFSLVAGTPVIVLSSTDHKLSSGVKWFPESFRDYVRYVPELSEVHHVVQQIYEKKLDYCLEPYFQRNYYSKLRQMIEGIEDATV